MKTLRKSPQKDLAVKDLQNKLNRARAKVHGNWPYLNPDGVFGNDTENAVKAFQCYSNISRDGIVGPKTWEKLEKVCNYRHLIEPALCDFSIDTNSRLFMLSITNDPDTNELSKNDSSLNQDNNIDILNQDSIQNTPLYNADTAMTLTNYFVNTVGAETALFHAKNLTYNEIWHLTKTRGLSTVWQQSRWNNAGAQYWRVQQLKPLASARKLSNTLTKAGFVLVGADILLSGEIKPSHGINAFMLGISFTGYGAIIAAGWLVIDLSVGGYNWLAHGEWESLGDKIDKKLGKIEMYEGLY